MKYWILVLLLACLGFGFIYALKQYTAQKEPSSIVRANSQPVMPHMNPPDVNSLLKLTNAERIKRHLPKLILNANLNRSAQDKCKDLIKNKYFAHTSPSGKTPWQFIAKYSPYYHKAGENLAEKFEDSEATITAWMASPEHMANILDKKFTDVGFGVCKTSAVNLLDDAKLYDVV